jgi:hypothetical protein
MAREQTSTERKGGTAKEKAGRGKEAGGKEAHGKEAHGKEAHGKEAGGGHAPAPIQVQKYLSGLDYPVDKQQIIEKAKAEGAGKEVMAALEQLPERQYDSPVSVSRELGSKPS